MSVVQACAKVEAAMGHARSLFAAEPEPSTAAAATAAALTGAAQTNTATGQLTAGLSGALITEHKSFADQSAHTLTAAARSDATLNTHLTTAATLTRTGAARLAAIAAETRATSRSAAAVTTPAGQRTILAALQSQLAQASEVVSTAEHQVADLAGQIRALQYPLHNPQSPQPSMPGDVDPPDNDIPVAPPPLQLPPFPAGPIVWCVRPEGTFGFWRCSVLYPDLSVGTYWSPTDDTGGSLP
jgi:Domain of unknown function (DUF4226)